MLHEEETYVIQGTNPAFPCKIIRNPSGMMQRERFMCTDLFRRYRVRILTGLSATLIESFRLYVTIGIVLWNRPRLLPTMFFRTHYSFPSVCIIRYTACKNKFARCVIKHDATKMYGEVGVQFHAFLTSELDRGEWPASPWPPYSLPRYPLAGLVPELF